MTTTPPQHETADEWARRAIAEHGPIPDHLLTDIAARLRAAAARQAAGDRRPA